MNLKQVFFRIGKYLKYIFKTSSAYSLHSPFVYGLYQCVKKTTKIDDISATNLDSFYEKLKTNKSKISFVSVGAKSGFVETTVSDLFKRTSKSKKQAEAIASMAKYINATKILELGTALASTTLTLHKYNINAKIVSIEGVPEIAEIARKNIESCTNGNVEILQGCFMEILPMAISKLENIDFAFLDGHHQSLPTIEYLNIIFPYLSERAIVIIDDIYYSSDMCNCWSCLTADNRFQVSLDFFDFGVLVKNADLQKEKWVLK